MKNLSSGCGAYHGPDMRVECGQRIGQLWAETLRYHQNVAYLHEVQQVQNAVEWLRANADEL